MFGGGTELHVDERLLRRDLEQREIGLGVPADDLVDGQRRAVVEIDVDLLGAVDDVIVGDDQAFLAVDDEAGARATKSCGRRAERRRAC